ncbi:hypothetical protein KR018_002034 [Drosophila ironensis]|nr:hypothetical protein KR018_002034 [Drosophila ironensis]
MKNPSMNELMRCINLRGSSSDESKAVAFRDGEQLLQQSRSKYLKRTSMMCSGIKPRMRCHARRHKLPKEFFKATPLHRTMSVDGLQRRQDSRDKLLWQVHSEGTLIPLPGIDSQLQDQMALLRPMCIEALRHPDILSSASNISATDSNWSVQTAWSMGFSTPMSSSCQDLAMLNPPPEPVGPCFWYLINMAHVIMVIACLRGFF